MIIYDDNGYVTIITINKSNDINYFIFISTFLKSSIELEGKESCEALIPPQPSYQNHVVQFVYIVLLYFKRRQKMICRCVYCVRIYKG